MVPIPADIPLYTLRTGTGNGPDSHRRRPSLVLLRDGAYGLWLRPARGAPLELLPGPSSARGLIGHFFTISTRRFLAYVFLDSSPDFRLIPLSPLPGFWMSSVPAPVQVSLPPWRLFPSRRRGPGLSLRAGALDWNFAQSFRINGQVRPELDRD